MGFAALYPSYALSALPLNCDIFRIADEDDRRLLLPRDPFDVMSQRDHQQRQRRAIRIARNRDLVAPAIVEGIGVVYRRKKLAAIAA